MNQNVYRAGVVVGSIVLLAIVAPIIWAAASAGIGLIALGVIGIVGFGVIQALPYFAQKIENTVLKLRKAEARGNPIEQLQNFMRQKAQQVADFRAAVMTINGQIKNLQAMVEQRKKERPGYDATAQEKSIAAMTDAYNALRQKYKNAENALADLQVVIQDKEFEWKFSQAGQQAMQTLNATSGKELMEAMLADEAFSSVTENFNKVFAELEMEAENLSAAKSLEFSPGMTIDVSAINLSNKVTV